MDDRIGGRQVEAAASRLERNEKHRRPCVALETLHHRLAIFGASVEVFVPHAVFFERSADEREHRHELAKYEHAMPARDAGLHELAQRLELA